MLQHSLRLFLKITLGLAISLVGLAAPALAIPPASVSLLDFRAENSEEGVRLEWETATELNTAGFRIHRAPSENGPFEALSEIGLITATGGPTSGSAYDAIDTTAISGQTYWYRLIEIEFNSSEHFLDIVSIYVGGEPTATVEAVPTASDGGNQQPPATTSSNATNTPSSSPSPTAQATTNTTIPTTVTPTAVTQSFPTPSAPAANATLPRPVGGVAQAAGPTVRAQPTALAQATSAYPEPQLPEATSVNSYPSENEGDEEPDSAPTAAITVTEGSYPAGVPNRVTLPPPTTGFEGTVGSLANTNQETAPQAQGSSNLSRILLWIGFVAALLIFIAGAFFSILLSTRRQRHDFS